MQLVIVAGGKGTRLKQRTGNLPKAMVPIGGRPLIEHQIELGRRHNLKNVLILTGVGAESIESHFGDGSQWGVTIRYRREPVALGTAGAVIEAFDDLEDVFLVMYGDTMLNVDLSRMAAAHTNDDHATLFLHPNDHPHDSDLVEIDPSSGTITAIHKYPHSPDQHFANLVNAALYIVSKDTLRNQFLNRSTNSYPLDFAKHVFPDLIASGARLKGYVSREYIKDAGTPERLDRVRQDYLSGLIERGSLHIPAPAVFLDRDGTLNFERGYLNKPDQLRLIPGAAAAVRALNRAGLLAVVVSNQPVIARGECTEAELRSIHNKLEWLLGEASAYLDGIYYCPHHPDKGFTGERPELKFACSCRKPATGLLETATRDLNIDVSRSWLVGDSQRDVQAATNFGVRSIQVRTGPPSPDSSDALEADFQTETVSDAIQLILDRSISDAERSHS